MIEVLQFLFATEKDQLLYCNQDTLVNQLIHDYEFTEEEINLALEWFAPIMQERNLIMSPTSIRQLSNWEEELFPTELVNKILELELSHEINVVEREVLFDRIGELYLDWAIDSEIAEEILNGLIYHMQNYKQNSIKFILPEDSFVWNSGVTIH